MNNVEQGPLRKYWRLARGRIPNNMTETNSHLKHYIPFTKQKKIKMVLPAIVLATSLHYSLSFTIGIVIGYALCKLFCIFFLKNGKVESIFLDYGSFKIHMHHWILGIMFLSIVWVIDHYYLPAFFAGAVCGIILQDIFDYNDWHRVIVKNPDSKEKIS